MQTPRHAKSTCTVKSSRAKTNKPTKRLALSATVAAALLAGYGTRQAYAGTCPGAAGTYVCSGAAGADVTQTLNPALTVTTTAGFGLNVAAGSALELITTGAGLSFIDANSSVITGGVGIYAYNGGTGAINITTTGMVTGAVGDGINAYSSATGTGVTINAAAVIGGVNGVSVDNRGMGAISITSTGMVTGGVNGILASNTALGSNVTVNAAAVMSGSNDAIVVRNGGMGATSITATGMVTSAAGAGISALNGLTATDLTINTAAVTGGNGHGINAYNSGTGATSITTTGTVTGAAGYQGIGAFGGPLSTSLDINTAAVTGGANGIYARNYGTDATNITVSGAVTGSTFGIDAIDTNSAVNITLNSGAAVSAASGMAISISGASGATTVNSGASITGSVLVAAGLNPANNNVILNGGTLNVQTGSPLQVQANVINSNGIINLQNNVIDAPATIIGDYTGGGQLLIDVDFVTDTADVLNINSRVLAGGTQVRVNDISTGAATGNDVTVISVAGTTAAGDFALAAPVVNGAFNYNRLTLQGADWVLQSIAYIPPVGPAIPAFTSSSSSFEALGRSLLTITDLPTLADRTQQRLGNNVRGANSGDTSNIDTPVWLRIVGGYRDIDSNRSTTDADFDTKHWKTQVGIDFTVADNSSGRFVAGLNAGYGEADTDVKARAGNSDIDIDGYSIGLTGTWYAPNGIYVDSQLQRSWHDIDLSAGGVGGGNIDGIDADGYTASIEVGKNITLNNSLSITPQAQLVYTKIDTETFTGANAEVVKLAKSKSLRARLGATLNKRFTADGATYGHLIANVIHEFEDKTRVDVSGFTLSNVVDDWTGQLGFGLTHGWSKGATDYKLSATLLGSTSLNNFGDSNAAEGEIGFRIDF